jgi:hypothetical protein
MSKFLETLVEETEQFRIEQEKRLQSLLGVKSLSRPFRKGEFVEPKPLIPIIKELEELTRIGARFKDGSIFNFVRMYDGYRDWELLIPTTPPCYVLYDSEATFEDKPFKFSVNVKLDKDPAFRYAQGYDNAEELLSVLAKHLAGHLSDLGLLDKSRYSQKAQDTLGIE